MSKSQTAFKAFTPDFKCHGFQFEVGETYNHKGEVVICNSGFHACENPLDVLDYYPLVNDDGKLARFAQVTQSGTIKTETNKSCSAKIKIECELNFADFIKKSVSYLLEIIKVNPNDYSNLAASGDDSKLAASGYGSKLAASGNYSNLAASGNYSNLAASGDDSKLAASGYGSNLAASGNYSKLAASGNYSKLAASGNYSKLAASGNYSNLAASGDDSKLAASGYGSKLAASGDDSKLAASGYGSKLAASGNYSNLAASGDDSKLAASGYGSKLAINGKRGVVASAERDCMAKGINGTLICLCHYENGIPVKLVTGEIGKCGLEPDVWYGLDKNGNFTKIN